MKKAFIELHIAVFLAGFTGILGKLIDLNEGLIVWYRLLVSSVTFWLILLFRRQLVKIKLKDVLKIFGVGVIAALHWVSFYGSIRYSNVSVGLVCFSAVGFFTAILEPLFFRRRINPSELLFGLMVILGIYCIFRFDPHFKTGIIVGLISAFLGSVFPILNKSLLERIPVQSVMVYELTGGVLFLSLLLPFYLAYFSVQKIAPNFTDWIGLLVLSWLCTVFAVTLSMNALKKISAFTVNLTYNLEPVYGIALAFIVLHENKYLGRGFYLGFALIILAIVLQMVRLVSGSRGDRRRTI